MPQQNRKEEFLYRYALIHIKGVGYKGARAIIKELGSATHVYNCTDSTLSKVISNAKIRQAIMKQYFLEEAQKEWEQMQLHDIGWVFLEEAEYPYLLKNTADAPQILYYKGNPTWNNSQNIAVVGTRKATRYGLQITEEVVEALAHFGCHILSGLALGIDSKAHTSALSLGVTNYAVLGHGLDKIYPTKNKKIAQEIMQNGALLTEYSTQDEFRRENFLQRNRIIAGMAHTVMIMESKFGGGAMTTARFAFNYDRDLYALPGKTTDLYSQGCNFLIKNMQARLLLDAQEIYQWFGEKKPQQKELFIELNPKEQAIVEALSKEDKIQIDELAYRMDLPTFELMPLLLELEFKEVVKALPGKFYAVC